MKKIILYSIIFILGINIPATAQSGRSKKAEIYFLNGEKEFANQRYMYAIPFYATSLKHPGVNDSLASLHIAQSYWYVKNYDSALSYYRRFEGKYGRLFSSMQRVAELAANHSQYNEAANIYKKLMVEIPARNALLLAERYKGFTHINGFLRYYNSDKFYVGLSTPALLKTKISYDNSADIESVSGRDLHLFLATGFVVNLNQDLALKPSMLVKAVSGAPTEFDFNANLWIQNTISFGFSYRTGDAIVGMAELQLSKQLRLGYAYDKTFSNLGSVNSGTHELMLRMEFGSSNGKVASPRYF
jgi:tetratricopeptide (TPR) repeat protein